MPSLCKGGKLGKAEQGGLLNAASKANMHVSQLYQWENKSLSPLRGQLPFAKGALKPSLCKGGKLGEAEQGGLCVAASEIKTPVSQLRRCSFC